MKSNQYPNIKTGICFVHVPKQIPKEKSWQRYRMGYLKIRKFQQGGHGAHFFIDKMRKIYQTAKLDKKAFHVGKIKSKCYETKVCTKAQLQVATQILFKKGQKYSISVTNLHNNEKIKSYPDRYPLNSDSIGIEIVGSYDNKTKAYESVGLLQNQSLQWLIGELFTLFPITKADIYRHPEISYKMPSEAGTSAW